MAYFVDLTPYAYFPPIRYIEQHDALNVGWLSKGHAFQIGAVPDGFLDRLSLLCASPVNVCRGWHVCEWCASAQGNGEIRVILGDSVFAAPVLVKHYIESHGYLPPQAFIDAVMAQTVARAQ